MRIEIGKLKNILTLSHLILGQGQGPILMLLADSNVHQPWEKANCSTLFKQPRFLIIDYSIPELEEVIADQIAIGGFRGVLFMSTTATPTKHYQNDDQKKISLRPGKSSLMILPQGGNLHMSTSKSQVSRNDQSDVILDVIADKNAHYQEKWTVSLTTANFQFKLRHCISVFRATVKQCLVGLIIE